MTEAELIETVQLMVGNHTAIYAVFLTLTSSYLISAYVIGAKLTPSQVWLLTGLYLAVITVTLCGIYAIDIAIDDVRFELYECFPRSSDLKIPATGIITAINVLVVAGSLKFMWDARLKRER
jgi:hypothetical protein